MSVLGVIAFLIAAISFLMWFWRLRANAGQYAAQVLEAIAAVLAILVVRRLTRQYDDYRADLTKTATPWAG